MQSLPFEREYTVGEPSATISNKELNVMYENYSNKFSVSVPGVSKQDVNVTCEGASISKNGAGEWIVKPTSRGKVKLNVYAKIDGSSKLMGSEQYTVKPKPKPEGYFDNNGSQICSGKVSLAAITNRNNKIVASYGPDVLIQLHATVTSFQVKLPNGQAINVTGNQLNAAAIGAIKKLRSGNVVVIQNIKSTGGNLKNAIVLELI
jgi:gliding motility-associated protein GldM